jgi:nucleoside-diphosphate-sugar epimerase
MSGMTTLAIFGLGRLGSYLLAALLNHPAAKSSGLRVRVLTRPGSYHRGPFPSNVTFHPIDYRDYDKALFELVEALSGVHCVISTVGSGCADPDAEAKRLQALGKHCGYIPGYAAQRLVAKAARKAGVSLFVPAYA